MDPLNWIRLDKFVRWLAVGLWSAGKAIFRSPKRRRRVLVRCNGRKQIGVDVYVDSEHVGETNESGLTEEFVCAAGTRHIVVATGEHVIDWRKPVSQSTSYIRCDLDGRIPKENDEIQ